MLKNNYTSRFFHVKDDLLDFVQIKKEIEESIYFSGSNLWILFAAILLASLGLNINSTAVIIGAMLISPLMGPIIGIGIGASINDVPIIKRAFSNYVFAVLVSIVASSIYFLFTPLSEAYSELLARTTPNIYDVLIALFGGAAGIIAISSKNRGNVLPGVAIATALMPPLCTAGYGIATGKSAFFFGAIYLFIINSVFIALSAYLFARFLKFPLTRLKNKVQERNIARLIIIITSITVIPSVYFGYELIQKNKFETYANRFIQNEFTEEGILVLRRNISYKNKTIDITILDPNFDSTKINAISNKLAQFSIPEAELNIRNGMIEKQRSRDDEMGSLRQNEIDQLRSIALTNDSIKKTEALRKTIQKDLRLLFPSIEDVYYSANDNEDYKILIQCAEKGIKQMDTASINRWLLEKLNTKNVIINYMK